MTDELELKHVVRKRSHRTFMKKVVDKMGEGEGIPDAVAQASQETFKAKRYHDGPRAQLNAYRKGAKLLQRPELQRGFQLLFESEGFDDREAIKRHIEHIRTAVPGQPLGNYQALRDYWNFTTPKPTQNVRVQSENMHAVIVSSRDDSPPPIRVRRLALNKSEDET